MGLCPSRKQAPKYVDAPAKTEKPRTQPSKLRADAEEFVPSRKQYVPKADWEMWLEAKQEQQGKARSVFTRSADGTFTAEYRQLLQTKEQPAEREAAPATGQVSEDMVRAWKEMGPFVPAKKPKAQSSKGAKVSPQEANSQVVLLEALKKVRSMPKDTEEPKKVAQDDAVTQQAQHRTVPFGLTDRHYLSDSSDAGGSHVHRSLTPTQQREYVDRPISGELEDTLTEVLYKLRLLKDAEASVQASRRYCVGLREVLRASKEKGALKAVVVAPDLEQHGRGSLDEKLQQLLQTCRASGTPVVFGLSRLRLGQAIKKSVTISVLGVLDTRGVQEPFERMLALSR